MREYATGQGLDLYRRQDTAGRRDADDPFGLAAHRKDRVIRKVNSNVLEHAAVVPVEIIRIGRRSVLDSQRRILGERTDQTIRVRIGQRTQQHTIDYSENGSASSNAGAPACRLPPG
jgi:hypothetical protein